MKKVQSQSLEEQIEVLKKDEELFIKHFEKQKKNLEILYKYIKRANFSYPGTKKLILLRLKEELFIAELGDFKL